MSLLTPDSGLLFWMVLIFSIVLFILAKWGFPVITDTVEKRNRKIDEALDEAKEAEKKISSFAQEQEQILLRTKFEQEKIIGIASQEKVKIIEKAKKEAVEEAEKIIISAKDEIAKERNIAIKDINRQVSMLSVDIAEKILKKELADRQAQKDFTDKMFEEMAGNADKFLNKTK
ncbi:MAG: F0F1 ATP synthase subunit B [Candidatus Cryptobacteroides sp.]|jgi:ATP synthase, F0 subunit b